jgi:hypothetical protein
MFGIERILIMGALLASVAGGAWFYVTSTDAKIEELVTNNAILKSIAEQNKETVRQLRQDISSEQAAIVVLNEALRKSEESREGLIRIYRKHDLTRLATAKPGLIEKRINNGTAQVFDDLESITRN